MQATDQGLYRELIRKTLANRVGHVPNAGAIAEATLAIWHQVAARLSPVIGVRGTDVLFGRALHLTSNAYPWLALAGEGDSASQLASIKTRLAGREPDTAAEASYALLATFVYLLTTLIGESLTERLLDPVWTLPPPASEKERVS